MNDCWQLGRGASVISRSRAAAARTRPGGPDSLRDDEHRERSLSEVRSISSRYLMLAFAAILRMSLPNLWATFSLSPFTAQFTRVRENRLPRPIRRRLVAPVPSNRGRGWPTATSRHANFVCIFPLGASPRGSGRHVRDGRGSAIGSVIGCSGSAICGTGDDMLGPCSSAVARISHMRARDRSPCSASSSSAISRQTRGGASSPAIDCRLERASPHRRASSAATATAIRLSMCSGLRAARRCAALTLAERVVALPRFPVEVRQFRIRVGRPRLFEDRRGPAMLSGGDQQLGVSGRRRRIGGIGLERPFGQRERAVGGPGLALLQQQFGALAWRLAWRQQVQGRAFFQGRFGVRPPAGSLLQVVERGDDPVALRVEPVRPFGELQRLVPVLALDGLRQQAAHPEELGVSAFAHGGEETRRRLVVALQLRRLRRQQHGQRPSIEQGFGAARLPSRGLRIAGGDRDEAATERLVAQPMAPLAPRPLDHARRLAQRPPQSIGERDDRGRRPASQRRTRRGTCRCASPAR